MLSIPWILLILIVAWSLFNGISPTPTLRKQMREIFNAVPIGFGGKIYDLGSGWGTLALALGKRFPNSQVTGIENSPVPFGISKLISLFAHQKNVQLIFDNFLRRDLRDADLVVCYLFPGGMEKVKPKLEKELRSGTLVISNTFAISGWQPVEVHRANDVFRSPIYLYKKD